MFTNLIVHVAASAVQQREEEHEQQQGCDVAARDSTLRAGSAESERLLRRRTAAPRDLAARGALYLVVVELDDGRPARPAFRAVAPVVALVRAASQVGFRYVRVMGLQLIGTL